MPDIKVYLRADDVDKWNAIEKKAEFLHNALNKIENPVIKTATIPSSQVRLETV